MSQTIAEPTRALTKPLRECKRLSEVFQSKEFSDRIAQAAPTQVKPGMILRSFIQATQRTPELLKVDVLQAIGGFMTLAELGLPLTPTLGMAYMIPFKGRKREGSQWVEIMTLQIIIGYQGLIELAMRSGMVGGIHSEAVLQGDEFNYEFGTSQFLQHRPRGKAPAGSAPEYVWGIGHLRGDVKPPFEVLPWRKVLQTRDKSQGYQRALSAREDAIKKNYGIPRTYTEAPWVAHEEAMGKKTVLRQLAKMLPKSVELQAGLAVDEPERGYIDFGPVIDLKPGEFDGNLPIEDDAVDPGAAFGTREQADVLLRQTEAVSGASVATAQEALRTGGESLRDKPATEPLKSGADSAAEAPKRGPGRPPKPKEAAPSPAAEEEPPPADPGDYGDVHQGPHAQRAQPEPASTDAANALDAEQQIADAGFEAYLFDETGEVAGDVITDPKRFARDYVSLVDNSESAAAQQIIENNAEYAAMVRTIDVTAGAMIDAAIHRQIKVAAKPEEAPEKPRGAPSMTVPVQDGRDGKPDWRGYLEDIKTALPAVGVTFQPHTWIDAQIDVLKTAPGVQRINAVKAITERLSHIGQKPPTSLSDLLRPAGTVPPAPAANPDEINRRYLDDRKSDVDACTTLDALRALTNRPAIKDRLKEMMETEAGKPLAASFNQYCWDRFYALGGKKPEQR